MVLSWSVLSWKVLSWNHMLCQQASLKYIFQKALSWNEFLGKGLTTILSRRTCFPEGHEPSCFLISQSYPGPQWLFTSVVESQSVTHIKWCRWCLKKKFKLMTLDVGWHYLSSVAMNKLSWLLKPRMFWKVSRWTIKLHSSRYYKDLFGSYSITWIVPQIDSYRGQALVGQPWDVDSQRLVIHPHTT